MRIQNNTCSRCGETQFTEYCEHCEPNMVWDHDAAYEAAMESAPSTDEPTDEDLAEMAAFYDELDRQARIDAYDDIDHDYPETMGGTY